LYLINRYLLQRAFSFLNLYCAADTRR